MEIPVRTMPLPEEFFQLYEGLPRQGPGSDASTRRALARLPALAAGTRVLDLGCGSGRQTLVLAAELDARITAIDIRQPVLDELARRAHLQGLDEYIETRHLSMDALDYPSGSIDLIWSEGAAYCIGVDRALELWRPLLVPSGCLAFTELSWFVADPPREIAEYLTAVYPPMTSEEGTLDLARKAGYEVLDTFRLPESDWWEEYYGPLRRRAAEFAARNPNEQMQAVIQEAEQEIAMYERYSAAYGYAFYLLRKLE